MSFNDIYFRVVCAMIDYEYRKIFATAKTCIHWYRTGKLPDDGGTKSPPQDVDIDRP